MKLKHCLAVLQLEWYHIDRYLCWVARHYLTLLRLTQTKEPVWTAKAKILYRLSIALFLLCCLLLISRLSYPWALLGCIILYLNGYLLPAAALLLIRPYEAANRLWVKRFISRKVGLQDQVTVVGITGSYGKTSTKMILHSLLSGSLMTPKSYNTLFGLYKVVDYEFHPRFRSFLCEMGACGIGEIKEFCGLVRPAVGILTGINETHLERFGSLENTISAKFELLQNLRPGGCAIVNLDNEHIRNNLERAQCRVIGVTVEGRESSRCSAVASVLSSQTNGSSTTFVLEYRDLHCSFTTPLLGNGHLRNVVAAIVAALELGETVNAVRERLLHLKQVPRRLEYKSKDGLNILDNSFSSNPDSFRESLSVLRTFAGRRLLVTPGIVELGVKEADVLRQLGQLAASVCDKIVLVGKSKQTAALRSGIIAAGYDLNALSLLDGAGEVEQLIAQTMHFGDTVLFENVTDLPLHYR